MSGLTPEKLRDLAGMDHLRHTHGDVWEALLDAADALEAQQAELDQLQGEMRFMVRIEHVDRPAPFVYFENDEDDDAARAGRVEGEDSDG